MKKLNLRKLNKLADEIIELFCVVDDEPYPKGTGIWGKDTELFSTDEKRTAREKAREEVINIIRQHIKPVIEGLIKGFEKEAKEDESQVVLDKSYVFRSMVIPDIKKCFEDVLGDIE